MRFNRFLKLFDFVKHDRWKVKSLGLTIFFFILVVLCFHWFGLSDPVLVMAVLGVIVAVFMAVPVWRAIQLAQRERRLDEYQYWICSRCEYPLDQASTTGRCPECGTSYTHRELQEYWIQRQASESGEKPNPFRETDSLDA